MKLYRVTQRSEKYVDYQEGKVINVISEHYYHDLKKAREEYYKMKKHYISCKPEQIKEDKYMSGEFANFWDIEIFIRESCVTYVTSISVIETQD